MRFASILIASLFGLPGLAQAQAEKPKAVAELFTSQSCSSCPPAERYFRELSERDDVVVIEWHVDYWDELIHGRAGAWKDPYSDAAHTKRQRGYNANLRQTWGVYTPQAVVNGTRETVGFKAPSINSWIEQAPALPLTVDISSSVKSLSAAISGEPLSAPARILRVELLPAQTTRVLRGENHGKTLASANIALGVTDLGTWQSGSRSFNVKRPKAGNTCAILVQRETRNGPAEIIGASYCPE